MTVDDLNEDEYVNDGYEGSAIQELEQQFRIYGVPFQSVGDYILQHSIDISEEPFFRDWFESQSASFDLLWEKLADEAFHILFSNRRFLVNFGDELAHFITAKNVEISNKV